MNKHERERLAILAEEASEVIQVIGKILRHGYESTHPDTPDITNRDLLEKELGDLMYAINLVSFHNDVDPVRVEQNARTKEQRIQQYLHEPENMT